MSDYTLGQPPRINFLVTTDYATPMNYGGTAGGQTTAAFTLHLEVPLRSQEASQLSQFLAQKEHEKAHGVLKQAMARDANPADPKSKRCYDMVAAAFARDREQSA